MRVHILFFASFLFALLFGASQAYAASFAKQSMFLSQSTVTEGETVFIYAVVTNDSPQYFSGTLKFADGSGPIGSASVGLKPGVASTVSVAWKPSAGQHTVTANLVNTSNKVVESEESIFFVNEKPSPAVAQATQQLPTASSTPAQSTIESSQPLEEWVGNLSPAVGERTTPILRSVDSARATADRTLQKGSAWSKDRIAQTAREEKGWLNTLWLILATVSLYVCTVLSYAISTIGIFYPIIAAVFFYILWRLYRMVRR